MTSKQQNPRALCEVCRQVKHDARHQHPHDFSGALADMEARRPCLTCNQPHAVQP